MACELRICAGFISYPEHKELSQTIQSTYRTMKRANGQYDNDMYVQQTNVKMLQIGFKTN